MSVQRWMRVAGAAAAAVSLSTHATAAQSGTVSAVSVGADHDLLRTRLLGGAARLAVPLGDGRASLRFGAERVIGSSHRTGSTCSGLVQAGSCPPEPLRDNGTLSTASLGLGYTALTRRQFALDLIAGVRVGRVQVETRGLSSGAEQAVAKELRGVELGVDGSWIPVARVPVALEVGATIGELGALYPEQIVDGYTPFEGSFTVTRLRVGISWRPSRR